MSGFTDGELQKLNSIGANIERLTAPPTRKERRNQKRIERIKKRTEIKVRAYIENGGYKQQPFYVDERTYRVAKDIIDNYKNKINV